MKKKGKTVKQRHWVKRRHTFVFAFLRIVMHPFFKLRYNYRAVPAPIKKGPCIILFNHQTTMDPFFVSKSFRFPVYFFASDDLFNLKVSPLIRYLAAPIPTIRISIDPKSVIAALRILREGGAVGIAPEGNRTLSGRLWWEIPEAVAKLVKTAKCPLVLYNLCGGFGTDPRWGTKIRKGTRFDGFVKRILDPKDYADLSVNELFSIIKKELDVDDTASGEHYRSRKRAEHIERALYICPVCRKTGTIRSHGTKFFCTNCKTEAEYTETLSIVPPFGGYSHIYEWFEWERVEIVKKLRGGESISDTGILFRDSVKLKKKVTLPGDTVKMTNDCLIISGESSELCYPIKEIDAITAVGKKKFNFYYKDKILQVKGDSRFCPIKYVHAFEGLKNAAGKEEL